LISWSLYLNITSVCKGNYNTFVSTECNNLLNEINNAVQDIDPYDIYTPGCTHNSKGYNPVRFYHPLINSKFDPCIDLHLTEYLNRVDVRKAIHADDISGKWEECSDVINYNFTFGTNMIPYYRKFFREGNLKILIYSGDVDSVIPFLGTEKWIDSLNLNVKENWRPWMDDKQVGGYVKIYDGLTFISIRGSGHMVPYFKPKQGYAFFERFIEGKPF